MAQIMTNAKLNYLIGNGKACVKFLDDFATGTLCDLNRNMVLNHGIAVQALITELETVELEKRRLHNYLDECSKELRMIRVNKLDPILEKRFEELKESLISYIEEY